MRDGATNARRVQPEHRDVETGITRVWRLDDRLWEVCLTHRGGGDVRVTVTREGPIRTLPLRVTDTLFHIGTEAITNAIRHAQSETVEVHMKYEANAIVLRVQDHGIGFIAGGQVRSHGLRDMKLRAASISADMHIHSAPGEGACIEVMVPLHSRKVLAELASHGGQYIMHLAFKAGQTLGFIVAK